MPAGTSKQLFLPFMEAKTGLSRPESGKMPGRKSLAPFTGIFQYQQGASAGAGMPLRSAFLR
jgi:hypothetical protein